MLDVVRLAAEPCLPLGIDIRAVIGMDGSKKRLVGQRRPLRNSEDAIIFVRPGKHIPPDIEPPAPDASHFLSTAQIFPALPERLLSSLALCDVPEKTYQYGFAQERRAYVAIYYALRLFLIPVSNLYEFFCLRPFR